MASSAYNYSVRQGLNSKGVDNSRIGFSNGYVTVDGKNFQRADKNYNGSAFTNQQNFGNAWNTFNQPAARTTQSTPSAARVSTASPTPGSVPVRSALTSAGYNPSSVGYSNGAVTVNNQPFTVPSQNINGTSYTSPNQFNKSLNNTRINDLTTRVTNGTSLPENRYTPQIDDTISYLMNFAKNQQQIDPYSTPQYAAYQAQSDRRATDGIRAAQESMGSAGFGRSTALGERAQGVQNQETEYLETQVIPQIIAAEQARQQQQYANITNLLTPLYNQQQSIDARAQNEFTNMYNVLNTLNEEKQRGIQNSQADAALTGYHLTEDQQNAINTMLSLKQQAETPGISREQKAALTAQANGVRSQMSSLGLDPAAYGANISLSRARQVQAGRTIQGQQLDESTRQYNEEMAYKKVRDAITDKQWQQAFDRDVSQFGMTYALQSLQEQNNTAFRQATLALDQDQNTRQWLEYGDGLNAGTQSKYNGATVSQVVDAVRQQFVDPNTKKIPTDDKTQETIYQQIVGMNLPDGQDDQAMLLSGLSHDAIKKFDKKYGISSGN